MALDNIDSRAPEEMQPYLRVLEKKVVVMESALAVLQIQINSLLGR